MTKPTQLLISLSLFLLSILIGNLPFLLFSTKANSMTQIEPKKPIIQNQQNYSPGFVTVSQKLNDFSLQDENGKERSFVEIKGDNPALIYFFAGGCGHCLQMLPQMQQNEILYRAKSLGYSVMAVEYYGTPAHGKQMLEQHALPSPILADSQARVCQSFGVGEFTIFLVGKDNILYFRDIMNGSNWPNDALLKDIASKNAPSPSDSTAQGNSFAPANSNNLNNDTPKDELKQETSATIQESAAPYQFFTVGVSSDPFSDTYLASSLKAQKVYQLIYLMALVVIFLGTLVALSVTKESWLPVLAVSQMVFLGTYYNVWIQKSLIPIFFIIILCLMFKPQKNRLVIASICVVGMFLASALINIVFATLFGIDERSSFIITWQVTPAIVSSLVLLYLSLNIKQNYIKYTYEAPVNFSSEPLAEGVIAIRGVSKAERCDICHQVDQFNFETSFCKRCNTKTI